VSRCPLIRSVQVEGQEKPIYVCVATSNSLSTNDGTAFRIDMLQAIGFNYCYNNYRECPFYKWFKKIAPELVEPTSKTD